MIDTISRAPLFKGLHPEVISGIVENANERQFTTGQLIIQKGDSLKELYIIIEGEVSIEKNSGEELFTRSVGESLGEMTLIDLGTRSVSVRAKSDVNIAVIDLEYLTTLFDNNPKILTTIAINIARILSNRLRESDEDSKA
ncbi:MAG: cyclic nucleotide-binding domain-containing protein [Candidatus Marinimicrobia bacterium]|nr:cyclic nucleotide-binding domain-containing protein [Candidatus Neomarinimicrobiota bacterium]